MNSKDISKFPGPISLPYLQSQKSKSQRKDLLRFAFENAMSLLGAIIVGDLLDRIEDAENDLEHSEDTSSSLLEKFSGEEGEELLKPLRHIGMEQMSLGKWVNLIRTMSKFVSDLKITPHIPEALQAYKEKSKSKEAIDTLVTIRNKDAHGPTIAESELEAELANREKLLMTTLDSMSFLENWRLVQLEQFEIESGTQVYYGSEYASKGTVTFAENISVESVPLHEPILVHQDGSRLIRLMPLVIITQIDGKEESHLAMFSKEIKGSEELLHFLSSRGVSDVNVTEWSKTKGDALPNRRSIFVSLFQEPELVIPNVEVVLSIDDSKIQVDEDKTAIRIKLKNAKDSTCLESVCGTLALPTMLRPCGEIDGFTPFEEGDEVANRYSFEIERLDQGENVEFTMPVMAIKQGTAEIPQLELSYKYKRTEDSEDFDTESNEVANGPTVLAIDPNAPDPMCPIVNVERSIHTTEEFICIGDRFEFHVSLKNIGLGAACHVMSHVIIPDGLLMLDGPQQVRANLLPDETSDFRWTLRADKPGIYHVRICDIIYQDLTDKKYATECSEEYRFLVRSDKKKELRFKIRDIIDDLKISEAEETEIAALKSDLTTSIPDEAELELFAAEAKSDAIIEVVRRVVSTAARDRNIPVIEKLFVETKPQSKEHKERGQRRLLTFFRDEIPFFAFDFTDKNQSEFYFNSFDVQGGFNPPFLPEDSNMGVFASKRKTNGSLNVCLSWDDLSTMEKPVGVNYLKGWIGRCFNRLEREFDPWKEVATVFAKSLGGRAVYRFQRFEIVVPEEVQNDLALHNIADPTGSYKCCAWCYRHPEIPQSYVLIVNVRAGAPGMSKGNVKWIQGQIEVGNLDSLQFYASYAKRIGGPIEADRSSYWLGTTINWENSNQNSVIETATEKLIKTAQRAYPHDIYNSTAAKASKKGDALLPLKVDDDGVSWLKPHLDSIHKAGVGIRCTMATNSKAKNTIEFYRLSDKPGWGGAHTSLARIHKGEGGDGELWLNWYEGMDESLPIVSHLALASEMWPESNMVPRAVRFGLWLRVDSPELNQQIFDDWIAAIHTAAPLKGLGVWPEFAQDEILKRTIQCNSRLSDIVDVLSQGPKHLDGLKKELGGIKEINSLLYWQSRYHRVGPIQKRDDGLIELTPSIRKLLTSSLKAKVTT
jgi:hypothetical protein